MLDSTMREDIQRLVRDYNQNEITISALGSHSALDIMDGAKDEDFRTLVIAQVGRERPYKSFDRIVDDMILLDRFDGMIEEKVQESMRKRNVCLLYTSPSPRDRQKSRMPSSA